MKITGKHAVEFDVEVDDDTSFTWYDLSVFFSYFNAKELIDSITDDILVIENNILIDCECFFDYFIKVDLLAHTSNIKLIGMFAVIDEPKLITLVTELEDMYNDLSDNYKAYEREFLIDSII